MANVPHIESLLRELGGRYREYHRRESERVRRIFADGLMPDIPSTVAACPEKAVVPCCAPFDTLQRTSLKLLKINEVARGKYLLLRSLEHAYNLMDNVFHVVEDHLGFITFLHLYHYIIEESETDEYFPIGTMIIVKEPFFELTKKSLVIHVDCPTDVIVLRSHHELYRLGLAIPWINTIDTSGNRLLAEPKPSSGEDWKKRGNEMYESGKYYLAVEGYSLCLREAVKSGDLELKRQALTNLAAAYLKLGCFESVVESAEKVLVEFPDDKKALYRAGRAYYELRDFQKSRTYLEKLTESGNVTWKNELTRVNLRLNEQKSGIYDLRDLYCRALNEPKTHIDVADYVGAVKISEINGKRWGVVATEDIKVGTILVGCKAFKACFRDPEEKDIPLIPGVNSVVVCAKSRVLKAAVGIAVYKNPNVFGALIHDLFFPTARPQRYCNPDSGTEPIINMAELKKLTGTRTICIDNKEDGRCFKVSGGANYDSALFVFPSYIQHNCLPNCFCLIFNDVMIIRAIWPIKSGEELTIDFTPFIFRSDTQYRLQSIKARGFNCECLLCELDQMESTNWRRKRENLVTQFHYCRNTEWDDCEPSKIAAAMENVIADIEYTYKRTKRKVLKFELFIPHLFLCNEYRKMKHLDKMRETAIKLLRDLGFEVEDLKRFNEVNPPVDLQGKVYLTEDLIKSMDMLMKSYEPHCTKHEAERKIIKQAVSYFNKLFAGIDY